MTEFGRLALAAALSLGFLSPAIAQHDGELSAFANRSAGLMHWADHTWVTDFQSRPTCPAPQADYWYSAGDCHPSGSDNDPQRLSSADADLGVAKCIARPNEHTFHPGPATARIVYGIDGVCHQIANRILASTGTRDEAPITVAGARGYRISRFVYGEYGTASQWARLRAECAVAAVPFPSAHADLFAMTAERGLQGKMTIIEKEQDRLRLRIAQIGRRAKSRELTSREMAGQMNEAINTSLRHLASTLGAEDFQRLFDWPAEQEIVLVNPEVAARVKYENP
jgi:hypothetical protein